MTISIYKCLFCFPLQVSALHCLNEINLNNPWKAASKSRQACSRRLETSVYGVPTNQPWGVVPKKKSPFGCPQKKTGSHGLEHDWWWEYSLHISDVIKLNLERVFNYPPSYQRVNWICCQLNIMTNITKSIEHRQCPAFSHVLSHVFFNICSILFLLCSHVLMIFPGLSHDCPMFSGFPNSSHKIHQKSYRMGPPFISWFITPYPIYCI